MHENELFLRNYVLGVIKSYVTSWTVLQVWFNETSIAHGFQIVFSEMSKVKMQKVFCIHLCRCSWSTFGQPVQNVAYDVVDMFCRDRLET